MTSETCDAGKICSEEIHVCVGVDGDIDGDDIIPEDGDDCEGDDCFEEDGDYCEGEDCIEEDGDTDGDGDDEPPPDGDCEGGDCEPEEEPIEPECPAAYGLDALLNGIDTLPCFRPLTVIEEASSHDRSGGDGDCSSSLYTENGERVLMDSKRPGCLYRMWFGSTNQIDGYSLKFYFDGESQPLINKNVQQFFTDGVPPFVYPLVGEVNGSFYDGYYSYVPICYKEGLKVTMTGQNRCYQMTYHTYADAQGLVPFSMDMDVSPVIDFYLNALGTDPKPASSSDSTPANPWELAAGQQRPVLEDYNPHTIKAIWFNITSAADTDVLENVFIDIFFDGKTTEPAVSAPLGLFFGSGFGEQPYKSLLQGRDDEGAFYLYYPMPYWEEAIVKVRNESASTILFETQFLLGENPYPRTAGHFHAKYAAKEHQDDGVDYKALVASGKGHIAGITMAMESYGLNKAFLAGDDRIYMDGQGSPNIYGTGTDNFFNGANLFQSGVYENPLFSLWTNGGNPVYQYTGRRLFLGDLVTFDRSLIFGFEHGDDLDEEDDNTADAKYRSLAFYYYTCLEGLALTDFLDVFSIQDEQLHTFSCELEDDTSLHYKKKGKYEGEGDKVEFEDSGRAITGLNQNKGTCSGAFAIDAKNEGVRLVRMLNHSGGLSPSGSDLYQDAIVKVDGVEVGHWYTPGVNLTKIWKDSSFDIPPAFTHGKSSIRITFEYADGLPWTIYKLWVYSFLPPSGLSEGPGQVTAINEPTMVGINPCLSWSPPLGVPPTYYHIYRSSENGFFDCNDDSRVGTVTEPEWCDESQLNAQSTYWYRIQAEDCTGARGPCSVSKEVHTGLPPFCFEAEDTYNKDLSVPDSCVVQHRGEPYSNGKVLYCESDGAGSRFVLTTEVPFTGNYRVMVEALRGPMMGKWVIYLDSQQQSDPAHPELTNPFNGFSILPEGQVEPAGPISFGERYLNVETPTHSFQFRVQGKDEASTSYDLAIDRICLLGVESEAGR
ncbi:MAG: DUF2961 domain-containing protein [Myxococcales bacterium]|nr:MAG: DUF2961 domain-containing protein [Myxococcales bacterium]